MLSIRNSAYVLAALLSTNASRSAYSLDASKASPLAFSQNIAATMKPLRAEDTARCGVNLLYPALKNFFGQEIEPECIGSYRSRGGAGIVLSYTFGFNTQETPKSIDISIIPIGIDDFIDSSNHHHSSVLQITDGQPRLIPGAGFGNKCHNLLRTSITPISTSGWRGWTIENFYGKARNTAGDCRIYSPAYRCLSFVIGNRKMSAEFGGACFPRKRTMSLEDGISYHLFMEMMKSIRFSEQ